ncbi:MAG: copper chaperone PCu(A)C [Caulobacteraceae bacterium]|nr:copper chaperone PCu(A)C [Caulobacteraceae bacterium]
MRMLKAAALLGLALFAAEAVAKPVGIAVSGAWIQATPPGAATAAGYLTIVNRGREADRLVGAESSVAAKVQPHHMSMTGGIMRMRPVAGGLGIAAGATVRLAPEGDHLMLIGLKSPMTPGKIVKVTLEFARAGKVAVDVPVRAGPPAGDMGAMR